MRIKAEMDRTTNPSVYNKARKAQLEREGEINCSRCAFHLGENAGPHKTYKDKPKTRNHRAHLISHAEV